MAPCKCSRQLKTTMDQSPVQSAACRHIPQRWFWPAHRVGYTIVLSWRMRRMQKAKVIRYFFQLAYFHDWRHGYLNDSISGLFVMIAVSAKILSANILNESCAYTGRVWVRSLFSMHREIVCWVLAVHVLFCKENSIDFLQCKSRAVQLFTCFFPPIFHVYLCVSLL